MAHPHYYRRGEIEPWDFIRDQGLSFHLGNAIKYICRAGHKDSYRDDLEKAIHYLTNELQHVSTQQLGDRIPPSIQYTERFEPSELTKEFDR